MNDATLAQSCRGLNHNSRRQPASRANTDAFTNKAACPNNRSHAKLGAALNNGMGMNLAPVSKTGMRGDRCSGMDKAVLWRFRLPLLNQEIRSLREEQVGIVNGDPRLPCTKLSRRI